MGYPANLILTWKYRRHLDPKVCLPSAVLVLAGSIPGAIMLKNVGARSVKITAILLVTSGISLILKNL
jgi:uncharacterized membrane protein YfcA